MLLRRSAIAHEICRAKDKGKAIPLQALTGPEGSSRLRSQILTLNLLTTTIVAPPSNASIWQMGFNSAFKGMHEKPTNTPIIHSVY